MTVTSLIVAASVKVKSTPIFSPDNEATVTVLSTKSLLPPAAVSAAKTLTLKS